MKHFKLKRLRWRMRYWSRSINKEGFFAHIDTFNAPCCRISFEIYHRMVRLDLCGLDMAVAITTKNKE